MNIRFDNTVAIDVAENTELSFVRTNMLFAFDNVELERTTEFELPATPRNNALFQLGGDPHFKGNALRYKMPLQLQAGGFVKNGYLYITSYDATKQVYKAVFVCGELLGLSAIKEAGKIAQYIHNDDFVIYPNTEVSPANIKSLWGILNYKRAGGYLHPSSDLQELITMALTELGYNIDFPSTSATYRIIPANVNVSSTRDNALKTRILLTSFDYGTDINNPPLIQECAFDVEQTALVYELNKTDKKTIRGEGTKYGNYRHLVAKVDIKLSFSDNVSEYYFLRYLDTSTNTPTWQYLGDYVYIGTRVQLAEGEPLTGRTITLKAGTEFMLFKAGTSDGTDADGKEFYRAPVGVASAGESEEETGQPCYLIDNIPDINIVDACKVIAGVTGTLLAWDEEQGKIYFDASKITEWETIDITKRVISVGNITRTFGDYAQYNDIVFDNGENVREPLRGTYRIENENIEKQANLLEIPFSAGDKTENGYYYDRNDKQDTSKDAIAKSLTGSAGETLLMRVEVPLNDTINNLCDNSTSLEIVFACPLVMYERINYKTLLHYNGVNYAWTKLNWSNDKVSATLAKVAVGREPVPQGAWLITIERYFNADGTFIDIERSRYDVSADIGREYYSEPKNDYSGYIELTQGQSGIIQEGDNIVIYEHRLKTINVGALTAMPYAVEDVEPSYVDGTKYFDPSIGLGIFWLGSWRYRDRYKIELLEDDASYSCNIATMYNPVNVGRVYGSVNAVYRCTNAIGAGINDLEYRFVEGANFDINVSLSGLNVAPYESYKTFILYNTNLKITPKFEMISHTQSLHY